MRIISNLKHHYAIRLKFGHKFKTCENKLVLKTKANIQSTIKENILIYCRKFSSFAVVVVLQHIFITRSLTQENTAC